MVRDEKDVTASEFWVAAPASGTAARKGDVAGAWMAAAGDDEEARWPGSAGGDGAAVGELAEGTREGIVAIGEETEPAVRTTGAGTRRPGNVGPGMALALVELECRELEGCVVLCARSAGCARLQGQLETGQGGLAATGAVLGPVPLSTLVLACG